MSEGLRVRSAGRLGAPGGHRRLFGVAGLSWMGVLFIVAILATGAIGASSAAASEWLINGKPITSAIKIHSKDLVLLSDSKAVGGAVKVHCKGFDAGTVGPGAADLLESITLELLGTKKSVPCSFDQAGACNAGTTPTSEAIHLPWKTEIVLNGTEVRDLFLADGNGAPGWAVTCTNILGGTTTDTCEEEAGKPGSAGLSNVSEGVLATFDSRTPPIRCSLGGAEAGHMEGTDLTESPSATEKLTFKGGGPPLSPPEKELRGPGPNPGAPPLEKPECSLKAVDCATGDETDQQTDLSIGGRGPGLRIVRSYDALAAAEAKEVGLWGLGWTGSYGAKLEVNSNEGTATVSQENGSTVVFYKSGETYTQGGWDQARLVLEGSNYVYTLPDQSKLEFNSEGKLVKEADRNGNLNTLTYKEGKLEKVADGNSRLLTFKYNGEGLVESVKDPMGHTVSYTYSSKQLASVTIEGKVRWKFEYESPHLLTKVTDGREHSTTIKYEATTHRATEEEFGGHKRKWEYKTNETKITEPNGSETLETFNSAGEPTKVTRAKGKSEETTTEYEYNASTYNLTKTIDGNKHETTYGYDEEGNKTSETDASSDKREWKYDKKHDVETETTPEAETTTYKLNSKGNPEAVERTVGSETQKTEYKYNEKGDLTEVIDPLKHATKYTYDAAGDKEVETDPESNERKWKYNEDSQVTEEISPRKFTTKTERDEQGRPTKITDPLGHLTEYKYDGNGNVDLETDGNKHSTKYEYNEENLRTRVEEPNKTLVETGYDNEGKMTSHTDGNKHAWEYKRNLLEQVTEEKNPLGKLWKKKYDKAGNQERLEDPEKHTTEYTYDESNRLKKIKYSTGKPSEATYEYNKDSKVKKMTDETGTTENAYDKLDRLTEYKNGAGKVVKYEYNLVNEPTKITYPNKEAVTREYDKDNRLEKVTDWLGKATKFAYNADSLLEKTTFPTEKAVEDQYAYDEADQSSEIKILRAGATNPLGSFAYTRDKDEQVTKADVTGFEGGEHFEYIYDENNRFSKEKIPAGPTLEYEYDSANSPTKIEGKGTYSYNEASQLKEGPANKYTYNEDGQRTKTEPKNGEPLTDYTYDQTGNLKNIEREKGTKEPEIKDTFTYDGNNLRQTQTIDATKTNLTWDTAEQLPLVLADETNSYIYGPEGLPVEQITSAGKAYYLSHDQQGSTRMIVNIQGIDEATYTYGPYGNITHLSASVTTPLLYDGQYTTNPDSSGELIYLRARTYDPSTAQFLSIDPALPTTGEPYTYTKDNPLNHTDAAGRRSRVFRNMPGAPLMPILNSGTRGKLPIIKAGGGRISGPGGQLGFGGMFPGGGFSCGLAWGPHGGGVNCGASTVTEAFGWVGISGPGGSQWAFGGVFGRGTAGCNGSSQWVFGKVYTLVNCGASEAFWDIGWEGEREGRFPDVGEFEGINPEEEEGCG